MRACPCQTGLRNHHGRGRVSGLIDWRARNGGTGVSRVNARRVIMTRRRRRRITTAHRSQPAHPYKIREPRSYRAFCVGERELLSRVYKCTKGFFFLRQSLSRPFFSSEVLRTECSLLGVIGVEIGRANTLLNLLSGASRSSPK